MLAYIGLGGVHAGHVNNALGVRGNEVDPGDRPDLAAVQVEQPAAVELDGHVGAAHNDLLARVVDVHVSSRDLRTQVDGHAEHAAVNRKRTATVVVLHQALGATGDLFDFPDHAPVCWVHSNGGRFRVFNF